MERFDPVMEEIRLRSRHRGRLATANTRGEARDAGSVITIELQVENDVIVAAGFETAGFETASDCALDGCASFLLYCAHGRSIAWAYCVRAWILAQSLRLPDNDRRAEMTVDAFRAALYGHRRRRAEPKKKESVAPPGAPRGHRKPRNTPPQTKRDLELLRPGETHEMLMQERDEILGVLHNLDGCLNIGTVVHSFRTDDTSVIREELICVATMVNQAMSKLSTSDCSLIALIGMHGMSESEAAAVLGISQQAVNKRLSSLAYLIQKISRGHGC